MTSNNWQICDWIDWDRFEKVALRSRGEYWPQFIVQKLFSKCRLLAQRFVHDVPEVEIQLPGESRAYQLPEGPIVIVFYEYEKGRTDRVSYESAIQRFRRVCYREERRATRDLWHAYIAQLPSQQFQPPRTTKQARQMIESCTKSWIVAPTLIDAIVELQRFLAPWTRSYLGLKSLATDLLEIFHATINKAKGACVPSYRKYLEGQISFEEFAETGRELSFNVEGELVPREDLQGANHVAWELSPTRERLTSQLPLNNLLARELYLFAACCLRRSEAWMNLKASREATDALELFANGKIEAEEFEAIWEKARPVLISTSGAPPFVSRGRIEAEPHIFADIAAYKLAEYLSDGNRELKLREQVAQTHLLRDLLPSAIERVLPFQDKWLTPDVKAIAKWIDAEGLHHQLPILADALEEGGCDDNRILEHCRFAPFHTRWCWVLECILGKRK